MSQEADDRAVEVLVAEFQFVAGLIPFYRRAELVVLGATGALLSVMVAALATLEAEGDQRHAEGVLLALGAWVPVLLLLIEVMALTRIVRASRYIRWQLHPLARELGGRSELLQFEHSPRVELIEIPRKAAAKRGGDSVAPQSGPLSVARTPEKDQADKKDSWRERVVMNFFSSTPLIIAIGTASIALAVSAIILDPRALTRGFSIPAIVVASALGCYGIVFTRAHEKRKRDEIVDPNETHGSDVSE